MLSYIGYLIKGALFGIANIIPGVSGGTIAVITGVYEKLLYSINNLFKDFKKSILFLLVFGGGAVISILAASKGVDWCIKNALFPTSCLFIGLILGGVPIIYRPVRNNISFKNIIIFILCMALVIGLLFIPYGSKPVIDSNNIIKLEVVDYILLGACGILASAAMIIPGISGMMMFYIFGYYQVLMVAINGLVHIHTILNSILVLLPVGIGIIIGLFTTAKLLGLLFKKFKISSYFGILGFVFGSICAILYNLIHSGQVNAFLNNPLHIALSITFLILGFVLTYILSRFEKKDNMAYDGK